MCLEIIALKKEVVEDNKKTRKQKTSSASFYPNEVIDSEVNDESGCDYEIDSDNDLDAIDEDRPNIPMAYDRNMVAGILFLLLIVGIVVVNINI